MNTRTSVVKDGHILFVPSRRFPDFIHIFLYIILYVAKWVPIERLGAMRMAVSALHHLELHARQTLHEGLRRVFQKPTARVALWHVSNQLRRAHQKRRVQTHRRPVRLASLLGQMAVSRAQRHQLANGQNAHLYRRRQGVGRNEAILRTVSRNVPKGKSRNWMCQTQTERTTLPVRLDDEARPTKSVVRFCLSFGRRYRSTECCRHSNLERMKRPNTKPSPNSASVDRMDVYDPFVTNRRFHL
jgi:hypothetical protein